MERELTEEAIIKILKKKGESVKRGYRKLYLPSPRPGNDWNSEVTSIYSYRGKVYLEIYHQLSHTDTSMTVLLSEFLSPGEWRGVSYEMDRYGNKTPKYCVYSSEDKAKVIKELLKGS